MGFKQLKVTYIYLGTSAWAYINAILMLSYHIPYGFNGFPGGKSCRQVSPMSAPGAPAGAAAAVPVPELDGLDSWAADQAGIAELCLDWDAWIRMAYG